jgi:hypothetical protein
MTTINLEEIPQGVLDDIADCFEVVTFENYMKPVTAECELRRSNYRRFVANNVEGWALDSKTFESKLITGTTMECYLVRGVFTADTADIYSVLSAGIGVSNFGVGE